MLKNFLPPLPGYCLLSLPNPNQCPKGQGISAPVWGSISPDSYLPEWMGSQEGPAKCLVYLSITTCLVIGRLWILGVRNNQSKAIGSFSISLGWLLERRWNSFYRQHTSLSLTFLILTKLTVSDATTVEQRGRRKWLQLSIFLPNFKFKGILYEFQIHKGLGFRMPVFPISSFCFSSLESASLACVFLAGLEMEGGEEGSPDMAADPLQPWQVRGRCQVAALTYLILIRSGPNVSGL